MADKMARPGSEGNMRLLKEYGGGSTPPRQSYPKGYATGGAVKSGGNPALAEGLSASGKPTKPSLGRPGRKMPGKGDKGKKGTNVNVIVMPKGGDEKPPAPPVPPDMPAAMPPPPPPPMPMPPPGAGPGGPGGPGGPMPPMRASGGRVDKHDDAKADKKMIAAAVHKHEKHDHPGTKMTKLSVGGPAKPPHMEHAAGGGLGRLEKARRYGK